MTTGLKKLYEIQITTRAYVVAEDDTKASQLGHTLASAVAHQNCSAQASSVVTTEVTDFSQVEESRLHDRPYGSEKKTIGEVLYLSVKSKPVTTK